MSTSTNSVKSTFVGRSLRGLSRRVPAIVLIAVLSLLVIYPLAFLAYASLVNVAPRPGATGIAFTLDNFVAVVSPANLVAIQNSLVVSVLSTVFSVIIGGFLAWLVSRTDVPMRGLVRLSGSFPLFVAPLVGALAWSLLASPRSGYINIVFREFGITGVVDVHSIVGMVMVFSLYYAPYSFLLLLGAFHLINPEFEEAAQVHGAGTVRTMRTIAFPLVRPAMFGASLLTFVLVIENFSVPQILGTPANVETIPSRIFRLMNSAPISQNEASAIGIALMAVVAGVMYLQRFMASGKSVVSVTGKGYRPRLVALGLWRWIALAFVAIYFVLAIALPMFALFQGALRKHTFILNFAALFDVSAFSLDSFVELFTSADLGRAFTNSMILGIGTTFLGGVLYIVFAFMSVRSKSRFGQVVEDISTIPVAMPALILSMGILWAWINLPVPVYGTMIILIIAYIVRFLPQGFQGIGNTIKQVSPELEEAAIVSGASRSRALVNITLPLIRTGAIGTLLLIFILSVRELTTSIFIITEDTTTLAYMLFQTWEYGQWGDVATISIFYSLFLVIVTQLANRWIDAGSDTKSRERRKKRAANVASH